MTGVEPLPDQDGKPAIRQRMGRNSFVLVTTRSEPPRVLERTIKDDWAPFSGRWLYQITPEGGGSHVRLTEHATITSAPARAVMKYILGYHLYLGKHLRSLATKLGEPYDVVEKKIGA